MSFARADRPSGQLLGHLSTLDAWREAQRAGSYRPASLEEQGFIHLSRGHQLVLAADTHYRGRSDLVVLVIDEDRLPEGALVDEAGSPPNTHLVFPHLYAALPTAAVLAVHPFPGEPDGSFRWPAVLGPEP